MHDCLQNIDFGNLSSDRLKALIQAAAVSPLYLKCPEVRTLCQCTMCKCQLILAVSVKSMRFVILREAQEELGLTHPATPIYREELAFLPPVALLEGREFRFSSDEGLHSQEHYRATINESRLSES